jgi:glutathione S-transferase
MALKLYAHPFSSYCQKAVVAFYEKNVPFDLQLLSSENPRAGEELKTMWPLERFPVLVADGRTLLETTVIIEWLDQHFPWTMRLIPSDPDQALEVRMYDRIFDNYVMTPMQTIVFDRIRPEDAHDDYGTGQARAMLDKAYAWLDARMATREWAATGAFTLADCAAAPALFYANWVHPFDDHTHLTAYYQRLRARPSVARAIDGGRPYRHFFPGGVPAGRD